MIEDHSKNLELIITKDGSHSLYNPALDETYHSTHGAIQESKYVFLLQGLDHFLNDQHPKEINVFEVGLGTGLNALLTIDWAEKHKLQINYTSIEAYPISTAQSQALNYDELIEGTQVKIWFEMIHNLGWEIDHVITDNFKFKKKRSKIEDIVLDEAKYDLIFFDAFAPSKQVEIWQLDVLSKIYTSMTHKGVFVTYCAQGQLKRNLKSLGLNLESLVGPPGKKEMVRAFKQ